MAKLAPQPPAVVGAWFHGAWCHGAWCHGTGCLGEPGVLEPGVHGHHGGLQTPRPPHRPRKRLTRSFSREDPSGARLMGPPSCRDKAQRRRIEKGLAKTDCASPASSAFSFPRPPMQHTSPLPSPMTTAQDRVRRQLPGDDIAAPGRKRSSQADGRSSHLKGSGFTVLPCWTPWAPTFHKQISYFGADMLAPKLPSPVFATH